MGGGDKRQVSDGRTDIGKSLLFARHETVYWRGLDGMDGFGWYAEVWAYIGQAFKAKTWHETCGVCDGQIHKQYHITLMPDFVQDWLLLVHVIFL